MAINIKFDKARNPEPPTIILANRNGNKLGQLDVNVESIDLDDKFSDKSEFSFTINKYIDDRVTNLWDKIVDLKLIYCKEWDTWFEISVEIDEDTEIVKTVFCTQLGQAELSQIMLYNIEINTEDDIARDDYKITILYDKENPKASLLHRILEKAPHYSIGHVDSTIAKIQRSFSFDGSSICDALSEVGEEIGCLIDYESNSNEYGMPNRSISVYDLQQNCNDCGYRGEFTNVCPKCGSKNIKYGYGEDTLIFVTADELAEGGIQLTTDVDSVKNCFKLEAGDDLMTATIRNCNPNGTDYIWRFSNDAKGDMSSELVDKINSYNEIYKDYYDNYESNIDEYLLSNYNALIDKYSIYNEDLQTVSTPIKGYSSLMNAYYNVIDLALYLESGLMPNVEMSGTNAKEQAKLLTTSSLSPAAVANISSVSLATANSAILAMAKIIVKSTYKVEIKSSEITNNGNETKTWEGNFIVTNYSDEEDTCTSETILVEVNGDEESFIKQKIEKALNKEDTDDLSISGLFEKDYDSFCLELKKYALNPLISFRDACQSCIDILIEQGVTDGESWSDEEESSDANLYEKLYMPYYNKLMAIESEIKVREDEINLIKGVYDLDGNLITDGLQANIEEYKNKIQNALDFESYLGSELWLEFCAYRREDKYSNDNYISDGLNNTELFQKALDFVEVAENEIYKSSELQCSISTNLKNLLAIEKFKPLVKHFKTGNWIRVQVDENIYKLRLLEYNIDYGNFEEISVEFSDITKIKNGITDVQDVLSQASSMATSYDSIKRQAKQGNEAQDTIDEWTSTGLDAALVNIQSNDNEEFTITKNGLLGRSYDDITGTYSPEQFRLTHNIMAYTTDNWETVSAALGKHSYEYYDSNKVKQQGIGYGLTSKFVTAGYVNGSQIIGGEIYSQNYTPVTGTYMDLNNGTFSWAGGKIKYDGNDVILSGVNLTWSDIGDAPTKVSAFENDADYKNGTQVTTITENTIKTTNVVAQNLQVKAANIDGTLTASQINTKGLIAENISGTTLSGKTITGGSLNINDRFIVDTSGNLTAKANANITGKITASSGSITGNLTVSGSLTHTSGNYTVTLRGVQSNTSYGVFYITDKSSGSNAYPFIVNGDGSFRATKATISGDSTFGGTLNAVSGTFVKLTAGKSSFSKNQVVIDASYTDSDGNEISKGSIYIGRSGVEGWEDITIRPSSDNLGNIGTAGKSWDMLYVKNGVVQSSDRNRKTDISKMGEKQEQLFNLLSPSIFKFIDSTYDRYHYGFISQEVEDAIIKCGLTTKDFAGFCKDIKRDENGLPVLDENGNQEYVYSLRYSEFIALNTYMIQKLYQRVLELENRL